MSKPGHEKDFQLYILKICFEFERNWKASVKSDFYHYLKQVEKPLRAELLTTLLDIDWNRRKQAGQQVSPQDYQELGVSAVGFVEKLQQRDDG